MNELGNPEITQDCIWNIYLALLRKFHDHRIIVEDEWHIFFDDEFDEKAPADANQIRGNNLNPLVIAGKLTHMLLLLS